MIKSIKSISKRTLALVLSMLMLLSSGIVGTLAANVELAPTGVDHSGGYIYFLKPSTWTSTYVMMFIGHDTYTAVYQMTKVSNTDNLYRYTMPSWSGATYIAFANADSLWGNGSWGSSNRTNATHYTNVYNNYQFNSGSYYLWTPDGTSNNTAITPSYYSSYSSLNKTTRANVYSTTADGTSYSSKAAAGTVTVSGYYMSDYKTATARSVVTSTSSTAYASTTLAVGSTATFEATANDGYEFEGWYSSSTSTTALSTEAKYTYSYGISTTAKTVYAKFREVVTDATVTFMDGTTTHNEQTVTIGETPTTPTAPTKTGYTFKGWSLTEGGDVLGTLPAITGDTTFYAVYEINTYTVTANVSPAGAGTAGVDPETVEHNGSATLSATANRGYNFSHWEKDGEKVSELAEYTISNITEAQSYTAVFDVLEARTVTITNNENVGTFSVTVNGTAQTVTDGTYNGQLYDGDTISVESVSTTHYYISSATINGTDYAENTTYFPNNLWTFVYDSKISSDLTIDITHTHNPYIKVIGPTNGTLELSDGYYTGYSYSYKVDDIGYTATANDGYYVSKVYTTDYNGNVLKVYYEGTDASITEATGTLDPLTVNTQVYAEFTAKTYYYVTINENGYTGSYTFGSLNAESDGTYKVESGSTVSLTVSVPTNSTHYISAIDANTYVEGTLNASVEYTVTENATINITYTARPTYTVTVVNSDDNMGSLNVGTQSGFYKNATYVIKPTANDGFTFKDWTVVGGTNYSVADDGTITITVDGSMTVTANWDTKKTFKVTLKAPASQGWASATGTDETLGEISFDTKGTKNWAEVSAGTQLTFTASTYASCEFDSWSVEGKYTNATSNGNTLTLTANGEVTVTANYSLGDKTFYIIDDANWTQAYMIYYCSAYPSGYNQKMEYNSSTDKFYYSVPADTYKVVLYQYSENEGNVGTITDTAKYDTWNNSTKAYSLTDSGSGDSAPTTYELTGGISLDLENYGDGIHVGTKEISSGKTSIDVYPYGSDGKYWNFVSSAGDNSANVTESSSKGTAVTIDLGTNSNGVSVEFAFDNASGTLSWTVTQMKETVNVTVSYGMNQNEADVADGKDIGTTYFEVDGNIVYSFNATDGGVAKIAKGEKATVYTSINKAAWKNGTPIHRVEGWVIDGTGFIPATSSDGVTFYGTYNFTEDCKITPIYFHTDAWLTANKVSTVTVYAVLDTLTDTTPTHNIEEWQDGISVYTWFYDSSRNNTYKQFDTWTGQYMIPVGNGVYKSYVETVGASGDDYSNSSFKGLTISGITFTNVMKATSTTSDWVQSYDYYEFKSLIDDGRYNITYVLRNHNTSINKDKNPGDSITTSNYKWMDYIDYSGNIMDIYRNVTKTRATSTTDNTLYIVRSGPYNITASNDRNGLADGEFYLKAKIYDASGNLIDTCLTYELVDPESKFFTNLKAKEAEIQATDPTFTYVGGTVKVSYEAENNKDYNGNTQATRYDGEWYGDLTDTTKVDINVLVGFTADNGVTIDVKDTNANEYGTATVNNEASYEVIRGGKATLLASEQSGYKFIGWYYTVKDDNGNISASTLLTTEYTTDIEASIAATYVAVYRERTGGEFDVLNLKYAGDVSDPSVPYSHGGESYRYVEVVHKHINGTTTTTTYEKTANGLSIPGVSEDDELTITIYTEAYYPEDYFYAWYMEVRDDEGKIVNFEEVAVSKSYVGSKEEVSFTFNYTVKQGDNGITIYSDIYHKEITKDIIYIYQDRYNNTKQYVKTKYTLSTETELLNGVPDEETIIKYAPWVEDLYKDTMWVFVEDKFTEDSWTLVATQAPTEYTVNVFVGDDYKKTYTGVYDSAVEIIATSIDKNATNNGFWYEDCGTTKGSYDDGDVIVAYGRYYGLRIKKDVDIRYTYGADIVLDYELVLDEAIYGREQSGENGAVDKIYVDYLASIHVPYFSGQTLPNGEKITEVVYDGSKILAANTPVTLETLEKYGYTVEHGIILEQVGSFKVQDGDYADFDAAEAAAIAEGYKTATSNENLAKVIESDLEKGWGKAFGISDVKTGSTDEYYTVYDLSDGFISNKNRYPFTYILTNSVSTRGRFYNVYAYIAITDAAGKTEYYFSNMQTLNTYYAGTNTSDAYEN